MIDGKACSPEGIQIRSLIHCNDDGLLATCNPNPLDQQVCRVTVSGETTLITETAGIHEANANDSLMVIQHRSMDFNGVKTSFYKDNELSYEIPDHSETPNITLISLFH